MFRITTLDAPFCVHNNVNYRPLQRARKAEKMSEKYLFSYNKAPINSHTNLKLTHRPPSPKVPWLAVDANVYY